MAADRDDDPTIEQIVETLDAIPSAYQRAQEGIEQARRGAGAPLDELDDDPS
jgi:hypothetical protein